MVEGNWKQTVREVFKQYHSIQRLGKSPLSNALAQGVTWTGDSPSLQGYAVRGALQWTLQLLGHGNHFERQSAETLRLRYVLGYTIAQCAAELHLVEGAVNSRQRRAIERATTMLADAVQTGAGLTERQKLAIEVRYMACSAETRRQLRFWSVFREPVTLAASQALNISLQPQLSELIALNWIVKSADGRVQVHPQGITYIRQLLEAQEIETYHTIAATFYEQQTSFEAAIYHWQQAHQDDHAATLLFEQQTTFTAITLHHLLDGFEQTRLSADQWAQIQLIRGQVMVAVEDLDAAFAAYEQALQTTSFLIRAQACYGMAKLYESRDVESALRYYQESRTFVAQCTGEASDQLRIRIWIDEAWVFINQKSDFKRAEVNLFSADTHLQSNWHDLQIDLYSASAELFARQNKVEECLEARWRAWFKANEMQDTHRMIRMGYNLADNLAHAQRMTKSRQMLKKVKQLALEAGDQRMISYCNKLFGNLHIMSKQDVSLALPYYQQAYDYFVTIDDHYWQGILCYDLAETHLMIGNIEEGHHFIKKGQKIAYELGDNRLEQGLQTMIDSNEALTDGLSSRQRQIIQEVVEVGEIRTKRCIELTGLSRSQAMRILKELDKLQILQKVGNGRGTHYILRSKN